MSTRWAHCLSEIDIEKRKAICSICGPTDIYCRPDGDPVCLTWRRQEEEARYFHSQQRKAIDAMGAKCEICAFDDWRALQIDHKTGTNGNRKSKHIIYEEILSGNKDVYQLLCANCNTIKCSEHNERAGFYKVVQYKR